ncbi:MAG: O-methyltransferase [Bacteroidota bacterium]
MSARHHLFAYLRHWLDVVDQHSIHSPFFFDFYNKVVKVHTHEKEFEKIEAVRTNLLQNKTAITVNDLGGGSKHLKTEKRTLADIASTSLLPAHYAAFYARLCRYAEAKRVLELGTSFGITTLYLAQEPTRKVFTFEGSASIADIALTNFEFFEQKNIQLVTGDIADTLPDFLQDPAKLDFVLMDANHRYEPTVQYFNWLMRRLSEKSIVAIDDIHQSPGMERAWNELKNHQLVYGSVDLFRLGLLFFDPALNHQHFVWSL